MGDCLGRPIVAPHQGFAGANKGTGVGTGQRRLKSEGLGHSGLKVKHQPVFPALGDQVQACANQAQQRLIALDLFDLKVRGKSVFGQRIPVTAVARRLGGPQNSLQVAQAAGGLLAIGLQRIGRIVKFNVALTLFQLFGDEKSLGIQGGKETGCEVTKERFTPDNAACLQQRGLHGHILRGLLQALRHRAHAGTNLQPSVPATANKAFNTCFQGRVVVGGLVVGQQHQHIHIGIRKQLAPPKPAHRQQGKGRCKARVLPQRLQRRIRQCRELLQR